MHRSGKFIAASLLTLGLTPAAFAQLLPPVAAQGQAAPLTVQAPGLSAQMPAQPAGGWDTSAPSVGASDPAERMTTTAGDGYVQNLTQQADKRLQALSGASVSAETGSQLDEMMTRKLNIQMLTLKNEEAELGVSFWGTLYDNEHARAWREQETKQRADLKAAEQEAAAARYSAMSQQNMQAASAPAALPVIFEVINGTALLLVPDAGETYVSAGTVLPSGLKVLSVGGNGVVVERDGKRISLGFGTSVRNSAPAMATP